MIFSESNKIQRAKLVARLKGERRFSEEMELQLSKLPQN
jgi:hypothetical protein